MESWSNYRAAQGRKKLLILAHTRADVRELNLRARSILRERSELGREVRVEVRASWRRMMAPRHRARRRPLRPASG